MRHYSKLQIIIIYVSNIFFPKITADLKEERRLAFRGMLLSALGHVGVLPKRKRDDFLANYTICPPPLFIPIITLVQVHLTYSRHLECILLLLGVYVYIYIMCEREKSYV